MTKTYKTNFRVYYEDTDSGGVVYYANYLKFAERARTETLRNIGINQSTLAEKEDIIFVVRHAEMDLLKPAKLDDLLEIKTHVDKISGASIMMHQQIYCSDNKLVDVKVKIACVNKAFKPTRLPDTIKDKFL